MDTESGSSASMDRLKELSVDDSYESDGNIKQVIR